MASELITGKKEFKVVIGTEKYNSDISFFISSYKLPGQLRIYSLFTPEKIVNFSLENECFLIILDDKLDYQKIIRNVQDHDNCKHFIVITEDSFNIPNEFFFENTIFIHPAFLKSNIFYNFFYQTLAVHSYSINYDNLHKKYKKLRNDYNTEKTLNNLVFNHVKEGLIILDYDLNIRYANKQAGYILKFENKDYQNIQLTSYLKSMEEPDLESILFDCKINRRKIKKNMQTFTLSDRQIILNYEFIPLNENDEANNIMFLFEDVTLQKKLWDEISKKKNLETLGLISEGIVHDLNNNLTNVIANINLMKQMVNDDNLKDYIIDIENSAMKSKNIINDFVHFYNGNIPTTSKGNLKELLNEIIRFVFRGSNISVNLNVESDLYEVEFNKSLLAQALKNIFVNSKEAISRSGHIIVNIKNQIINKTTTEIPEGKYVTISIEDDGMGIPKENLPKIFEQNFSTKGKDRGSGLAIVKSIIENHNGFIRVESREKIGTMFQIFLPACEASKKSVTNKERKNIKNDSTILVIENNPEIIETLKRIFLYLSLNADFCNKINIIENKINKNYDCIIIDSSNIEEKNLNRIIERFKSINKNIKIILLTHKYRFDKEKLNKMELNAIIFKPFDIEEFNEVLGEVLS